MEILESDFQKILERIPVSDPFHEYLKQQYAVDETPRIKIAAEGAVTLYSDGACSGNPGPGGYGALIQIPGNEDIELSGAAISTTNNQMELKGVIVGLQYLKSCDYTGKVNIISDSQYVIKGMDEWLPGWKKKNFSGIKNPEMWKELDALLQEFECSHTWVKGHSGHPENEKCDALARNAIEMMKRTSRSI